MTWARFEDRFPWHRKVRPLSDAAFRLHVSAVCWSCEHLTDGKLPKDDLHLMSDVRKPAAAAAELVRRGVWRTLPDGWQIHDFLVYNEPRDTILARRAADAERKRKGREARWSKRSPAGVQAESGRTPDGFREESQVESDRPVPARPDPVVLGTSREDVDVGLRAPEDTSPDEAAAIRRTLRAVVSDDWPLEVPAELEDGVA